MSFKTICPNCQSHFIVSEKLQDQMHPCPKCKKSFMIIPNQLQGVLHNPNISPTKKNDVKSSVSDKSSNKTGIPLWVWIGLISVILILGGICVYAFGIRDTWERDNTNKIKQLADNASQSIYLGKLEEGLSIYDEMFRLIGDRELTNKYVIETMKQAKKSFEEAQMKYEENLLGFLKPIEKEAQNHLTGEREQKANELYDQINDKLLIRPIKGDKLKQFVQMMEEKKLRIKEQQSLLKEQAAKQETEEIKNLALTAVKAKYEVDIAEQKEKELESLQQAYSDRGNISKTQEIIDQRVALIEKKAEMSKLCLSAIDALEKKDTIRTTLIIYQLANDNNLPEEYRQQFYQLWDMKKIKTNVNKILEHYGTNDK